MNKVPTRAKIKQSIFNQHLSLSRIFKIIRVHHECEGGLEKIHPEDHEWHHKACRVMTNGDREGLIFYAILTRIINSFSRLLLNTSFYKG